VALDAAKEIRGRADGVEGRPAPSRPPGRPQDEAIFIGGMPRSGTSLMRAILGSHPDVAMFPRELPLWRGLAVAFAGRDLGRREERERLVETLVAHPVVADAGVALDASAILEALAGRPDVTLGAVFAAAMREHARRSGRPRWGVKEPRSEFHAERILAELPRAAFVHMIRDPRDVVASQRAMWGRTAQHVAATAAAWRRSAALARRMGARAGGYVAVRYEDLVTDPPAVVRRVCAAARLGYRPEMLEMGGQPLWPGSNSSDGALRDERGIFLAGVARHARQLAPPDVRFIELRAGREMERWGYPARPLRLTAGGRARLALRFAEEAGWHALRGLGLWPALARALGRLPSGS
jgi:hypothetical protein